MATSRGEVNPVMSAVKIPMIPTCELNLTAEYPFKELMAEAHRQEEDPQVLLSSVFTVQPYMDIPEMGWGTVVVTDGDRDLANQCAGHLAQMAWDHRQEYLPPRTSYIEALDEAFATEVAPVVVGDYTDLTGGGGTGDSTWYLKELLKRNPAVPCYLTMADHEAVHEMAAAGEGSTITLMLGGKQDYIHSTPVQVTGEVVRVIPLTADRQLTQWMGLAAVLRIGQVYVVVSEHAGPGDDPVVYSGAGLDPKAAKILVAKSIVDFRGGFKPVGKRFILGEAPGLAPSDLHSLEWQTINGLSFRWTAISPGAVSTLPSIIPTTRSLRGESLAASIQIVQMGVVTMSRASALASEEQDQLTTTTDSEKWLSMYRMMYKIRVFEEQVNQLYISAKMPGLAHLYIGQEAIAVGVCETLRNDDYVTSTHRGHGHCLAKGASPDRMFAELLGRKAGYCRGKGGSMHIADTSTSNLGANGIVGGSLGIATGAAFACRMKHTDQVVACFFGDGALGEGVLYEVMNMASIWKLPVIYICENNLYGEYTPAAQVLAGDILARPQAFDVLAAQVDGQDVRAVHAEATRLIEHARCGKGPAFLQCDTYRFTGHHVGDIDRTFYRPKEEEQHWMQERDPLRIASDWLKQRFATEEELEQIDREVKAEIDAAVQFALEAPFPPASEVDTHVYA